MFLYLELAHLELLLINYVKDMDGLRRICEKLRELRRSHETKLEVLNTQNRILHQEIAYLRNGRQHSMFASMATVDMPWKMGESLGFWMNSFFVVNR